MLLVAISIMAVGGALAAMGVLETNAPAPTTPTQDVTPVVSTAPAVAMTDPAPTTTSSTTTTTQPPTTTTIRFIEPAGVGLSPSDLTITANALGPLTVGDDFETVLGVLAASFGQPTADSGWFVSEGESGSCPGTTVRVVEFADLAVIGQDDDADEVFAGFRLAPEDPSEVTPRLATLSGITIGDSLSDLRTTYAGRYEVTVNETATGSTYAIRTLSPLWGPLSSPLPEGVVEGIYSTIACD